MMRRGGGAVWDGIGIYTHTYIWLYRRVECIHVPLDVARGESGDSTVASRSIFFPQGFPPNPNSAALDGNMVMVRSVFKQNRS